MYIVKQNEKSSKIIRKGFSGRKYAPLKRMRTLRKETKYLWKSFKVHP